MVDNAPQPDRSTPEPSSDSGSGSDPEPNSDPKFGSVPEAPFTVSAPSAEPWGIEVTHAVETGGTVTTEDGPLSPLEPE